MFDLTDFNSTVTSTRPDVVLQQSDSAYADAAVSVNPDKPWHRFIDELLEQRLFQRHHLSRVRETWKRIREHVGPRLAMPVTQQTPEGAIQLYWDTGSKYIEVDVYSDGTLHWFYKDANSGERDGTDDERVRGVPGHLLDRLVTLV